MLHSYLRRVRVGTDHVSAPDCNRCWNALSEFLYFKSTPAHGHVVADSRAVQAEELRRRWDSSVRKTHAGSGGELRDGMNPRGFAAEGKSHRAFIGSFAAYGFPESHHSFAFGLRQRYLKCRYLAAFTAAMLNISPWAFIIRPRWSKTRKRHGLHFKPIDVTLPHGSDAEKEDGDWWSA